MVNTLHLDGVLQFISCFEGYGWKIEINNDNSHIHQNEPKMECLYRITILAQSSLLVFVNTLKQGMRACTFFITGIVCLDKKRLIFAAKDYLSIFIQIIALPILGFISTFSSSLGIKWALWLVQQYNPKRKLSYFSEGNPDKRVSQFMPLLEVRQPFDGSNPMLAKVITCLCAPIQGILNVIYGIGRSILAFDVGWMTLLSPCGMAFVTVVSMFDFTVAEAHSGIMSL